MDTATAVGAPVQFDLHGQKIDLYALRIMHLGAMDRWMRAEVMAEFNDSLAGKTLNEQTLTTLYGAVQEQAAGISLLAFFTGTSMSEQVDPEKRLELRLLNSYEGMLRFVNLGARTGPEPYAQSRYALEELDAMIGTDVGLLSDAFKVVLDLSFPQKKTKSKKTEATQTPAKT